MLWKNTANMERLTDKHKHEMRTNTGHTESLTKRLRTNIIQIGRSGCTESLRDKLTKLSFVQTAVPATRYRRKGVVELPDKVCILFFFVITTHNQELQLAISQEQTKLANVHDLPLRLKVKNQNNKKVTVPQCCLSSSCFHQIKIHNLPMKILCKGSI